MLVLSEEGLDLLANVISNVVDDETDSLVDGEEVFEEASEARAVERLGLLESQLRLWLKTDGAEELRPALARVVVDGETDAYSGPAAPSGPFLLEADFVLEDYDGSSLARFFLMRGNVRLSQRSCAFWSPSASFSRGNWTLKPSWCRSFRTWPT